MPPPSLVPSDAMGCRRARAAVAESHVLPTEHTLPWWGQASCAPAASASALAPEPTQADCGSAGSASGQPRRARGDAAAEDCDADAAPAAPLAPLRPPPQPPPRALPRRCAHALTGVLLWLGSWLLSMLLGTPPTRPRKAGAKAAQRCAQRPRRGQLPCARGATPSLDLRQGSVAPRAAAALALVLLLLQVGAANAWGSRRGRGRGHGPPPPTPPVLFPAAPSGGRCTWCCRRRRQPWR